MTSKLYFMKCLERKISQCILPLRSCLDRTFQLKQEIFFAFQYLDLNSRYQLFHKFLKGKKFFNKKTFLVETSKKGKKIERKLRQK